MSTSNVNPYAPPAYNGMNNAAPAGYVDIAFDYVYDVVLTANQQLLGAQQPIANDADFVWRAILVSTFTGAFTVRFSDSQWYYLSSDQVVNTTLQGDSASPYPVFPEIIIPAGGRIGIDISDISGNQNTIEIVFRGVKRYRLA